MAMAPRIRGNAVHAALSPYLAPRPSHPSPSSSSSSQLRPFSHTCARPATRLRREMYAWLNGPGAAFKYPLPGSTNYLSAYDKDGNLWRMRPSEDGSGGDKAAKKEGEGSGRKTADGEGGEGEKELVREEGKDLFPFPLNREFQAQRVLDESYRELIYDRVVRRKEEIVEVSAQYGVSMERVAAVVRLKQLEKDFEKEGKPLARPYSRAVLGMIPTETPPRYTGRRPFESVNDLPVHSATRAQIFYPVPESRPFTREDAAKVFDASLLPADKRIPHPEMVAIERASALGLEAVEKVKQEWAERRRREKQRQAERKARAEERVTTVQGRRWDFKFEDISVEAVGQDGRDPRGVGWRYGFPHQDRKKGQVKIPTKVDA